MNPRERILLWAALAIAGLGLVALTVSKAMVEPIHTANLRARRLETDLERIRGELQMSPIHQAVLARSIGRSFGRDPERAAAASRARLLALLDAAGLAQQQITLTPATGKQVRGGREIGWAVRLAGPQERLTSLLYLLQREPALLRMETLAWSTVPRSTDVELQMRLLTLVLDPVQAQEPERFRAEVEARVKRASLALVELTPAPEPGPAANGARERRWALVVEGDPSGVDELDAAWPMEPAVFRVDEPVRAADDTGRTTARWTLVTLEPDDTPANKASLTDAGRRAYDLIAQRDVFRPYVKRPPPPPPSRETRQPPTPQAKPPEPAKPAEPVFRLVGLPTWGTNAEAVVEEAGVRRTRTYRPGQDLMGGELIMVDYRPLPHPQTPRLMSMSRVIVRIGREYWAVELGQTLAQRRLLPRDLWPAELLAAHRAVPPPEPPPVPQPDTQPVSNPQPSTSPSSPAGPEPLRSQSSQ